MSQEEDVYVVELRDDRNELADYFNELLAVHMKLMGIHGSDGLPRASVEEIRSVVQKRPIETVEERYLRPGGHYYHPLEDGSGLRFWQEYLTRHPKKIERFNKCVIVMNACESLVSFRRAFNEVSRLIRGKDAKLWFTGEDDHPDKLEM